MKSNTRRLFFALWPSELIRKSVVEAALPVVRKLEGRIIQPHNLHITLHFVGQVSEDMKDCIHDAARTVSGKSFHIDLDRFGHFSKAKILWIGPHELPGELILLHDKLGEALSKCGYKPDKRPYNPHVTLMRKCRKTCSVTTGLSIPWAVNEFVLVESIQDVSGMSYQVIEHYPLS